VFFSDDDLENRSWRDRMDGTLKKRIVVALGGNAILRSHEKGTIQEQLGNVQETCNRLASMISQWYQVVITHGNGPQVGNILIQNESAKDRVPAMPLDVCGAESQGLIGYMIQRSLRDALLRVGKNRTVASLITQVVVDGDDRAFRHPTKPVGPFYEKEHAEKEMQAKGEHWIEQRGKGWRRVVPSPNPMAIVEKEAIRNLIDSGIVVIACGGGGIPVIQRGEGHLEGVEAVIDKDLAAQCLARDIDADILLILTDVESVMLRFGEPDQVALREVSAVELRNYQEEGHFPDGSMGPKVEAALRFVERGGETAIITSLSCAHEALKGKVGTRVMT
jgi:carbamate kinase